MYLTSTYSSFYEKKLKGNIYNCGIYTSKTLLE